LDPVLRDDFRPESDVDVLVTFGPDARWSLFDHVDMEDELEGILGIKPGDMTEDGRFSLETVRCIGCCALAPCIRIDQDVYANVRPLGTRDILTKY